MHYFEHPQGVKGINKSGEAQHLSACATIKVS